MNALHKGEIPSRYPVRPFLSVEREEACRRMLMFLHEVKPAGYASYFLNPNSSPKFSHFTMIRESGTGIDFKDLSYTRDGNPYFSVPVAYLEDPVKWEAEVLSRMADDKALARERVQDYLGAVSPDEFTMDVIRLGKKETGDARLKVRIHPGMKTAANSTLITLFKGKGILAVPTLEIAV